MKILLKPIAVFMIVMLITVPLIGCKAKDDEPHDPETPTGVNNNTPAGNINHEDSTEYVYLSSFIQIPPVDTTEQSDNTYSIDNERVYISSFVKTGDGTLPPHTAVSTPVIHYMNLDGTGYTELKNYVSLIPAGADTGYIVIGAMATDETGNLWVYEAGNFSVLNLPDDFNIDEHEFLYEYYEEYERHINLKKLDDTGTETLFVDMKNHFDHIRPFDPVSMKVDSNNNLYVLVQSSGENNVYVFNENGDLQFDLPVLTENIDRIEMIRTSGGTIAIAEWIGRRWSIRVINTIANDFGEQINLPTGTQYVFSGEEDYDVLISNNTGLFKFNIQTGESEKLLDLNEVGMLPASLKHVRVLSGGRIVAIESTMNMMTLMQTHELAVFTRTPKSEVPEPITLTLATFQTNQALQNTVVQFNRRSNEYNIKIIEYVEHATHENYYAGLTKLSLEIISGNAPDILDVSDLPIKHYINKGLLVDLYELIDNDPLFNRSDLVPGVMRASEINGGFYTAFPGFNIITILGNPSVLGSETRWNVDEMIDVIKANPQADRPMGAMTSGYSFLNYAMILGMDDYVDWETGNVDFTGGDFLRLLEFARTLPSGLLYSSSDWELIGSGRQIMQISENTGTFDEIQISRTLFGGDIVFKGLPVYNGSGNMMIIENGFAITTTSTSITGAWEFLRMLMTKEWQQADTRGLFPSNQAVFDERLKTAMEPLTRPKVTGMSGLFIEYYETTKEEADQLLMVIDSLTGSSSTDTVIMNIILETAMDYFNGRHSSEDTVRIIQNRVGIYVSEQVG